MMERGRARDPWGSSPSPFTVLPASTLLPSLSTEGAVRFLLVSGERDDTAWGLIGAFWLSLDEARGGFIVSPPSLWHGGEMVRSYRGALTREWDDRRIFEYWAGQTGNIGTYMIDPEQRAASLFDVARTVGAV